MTGDYMIEEVAGLAVRRRVGSAPKKRASCSDSTNCPDVFELNNGDYAVIGADVGEKLKLPDDAGMSEAERIVVVPRLVMVCAAWDIVRANVCWYCKTRLAQLYCFCRSTLKQKFQDRGMCVKRWEPSFTM